MTGTEGSESTEGAESVEPTKTLVTAGYWLNVT